MAFSYAVSEDSPIGYLANFVASGGSEKFIERSLVGTSGCISTHKSDRRTVKGNISHSAAAAPLLLTWSLTDKSVYRSIGEYTIDNLDSRSRQGRRSSPFELASDSFPSHTRVACNFQQDSDTAGLLSATRLPIAVQFSSITDTRQSISKRPAQQYVPQRVQQQKVTPSQATAGTSMEVQSLDRQQRFGGRLSIISNLEQRRISAQATCSSLRHVVLDAMVRPRIPSYQYRTLSNIYSVWISLDKDTQS